MSVLASLFWFFAGEPVAKRIKAAAYHTSVTREARNAVQRVWPPNYGGYVWDNEVNDETYPSFRSQAGRFSELKRGLHSSSVQGLAGSNAAG
jgi:hypothetical protein